MQSCFRSICYRFLVLIIATTGLRGQSVSTDKFSGPDGLVRDAEFGVAFTRPAGWDLAPTAPRFGDQNGNIFLRSSTQPMARVGLAYQGYYEPFAPPEGVDRWLKEDAARRVKNPGTEVSGYTLRPDSLKALTIDGHPALTWTADFTLGTEAWREVHTQIVSAETRVLFFARMPAVQADRFAPEFEKMAASLRLTKGTWKDALDPRIFEARKYYEAREYAKAVAAFQAAFSATTPRAIDLVLGAGAAARTDQPDLALDWLKQAAVKDWSQVLRAENRPEFAALRDTEGWKKLLATQPRGSPQPQAVSDPALRQVLLEIKEEDQKYRRQLRDTEKKFGRTSSEYQSLWKLMAETDAQLVGRVTKILDERGWVGPDVIGTEAGSTLFLVIQHADLAIQQKYLPMMRAAVKKGAAVPADLALLEDRIALRTGRPQIYGSQIARDPETGTLCVDRLEDPEHVDERRASVGLEPLAAYTRRFDFDWDLATYKKQQAKREQAKAAK